MTKEMAKASLGRPNYDNRSVGTWGVHNQWVLILSFCLIGISWAAMMMFPFTILTNALSGANMGSYLGLFNGSICLPQIVASVASFALFPLLGSSQLNMFILAAVIMAFGALSVSWVNDKKEEKING